MLLHLILFLQLFGFCWFFMSKMLPVWECLYKEIVISTGLAQTEIHKEGVWPACSPKSDAFPFLRDLELELQGLDTTMYMTQQAGTGRCQKCWQGAAATAASRTLQGGCYPKLGSTRFCAGTMQCPRAGLVSQTSSRAHQRTACALKAGQGVQLFCSPVTPCWLHGKAGTSCLGPGPAPNLSKRLREFSGTAPACVGLVVLRSTAGRTVPLCNVWMVWDRWNTTLCNQVSVCPFTTSQHRH